MTTNRDQSEGAFWRFLLIYWLFLATLGFVLLTLERLSNIEDRLDRTERMQRAMTARLLKEHS